MKFFEKFRRSEDEKLEAPHVITASEVRKKMRVLLVEPKSPRTYWSYDYTIKHIGKKASVVPLGLITLGGMLPKEWELELADLNTNPLKQERIERADAIFIGGMNVQSESFHEQAKRAKQAGKTVVGGGAYVTTSPEECQNLDHLVLGEVEGGIHDWTRVFERGDAPKMVEMPRFPELENSAMPRYDLLKPNDYYSMGIQLSRGCPHDCEFCSVTALNGRNPRLKSTAQFLSEVELIRQSGFRGSTFVVDDNFIGNKKAVGKMLPELAAWQKEHGYPLEFGTQADLRLAKEHELMRQMVDAGFTDVFLGIETPSKKALQETGKHQNASIDLDEAVKTIAKAGLEPMAGFIMGFDSDTPKDLDELADFINRNPIPTAMVGVLQAAPKTKLHQRMATEGRLLTAFNGDQFGRANFETIMESTVLRAKYRQILSNIYSPENYFDRCLKLMGTQGTQPNGQHSILWQRPLLALTALKNSLLRQGLLSEYRAQYWKFLARVATTMPGKLASGIIYALKFDHLYQYTKHDVLPNLV